MSNGIVVRTGVDKYINTNCAYDYKDNLYYFKFFFKEDKGEKGCKKGKGIEEYHSIGKGNHRYGLKQTKEGHCACNPSYQKDPSGISLE